MRSKQEILKQELGLGEDHLDSRMHIMSPLEAQKVMEVYAKEMILGFIDFMGKSQIAVSADASKEQVALIYYNLYLQHLKETT